MDRQHEYDDEIDLADYIDVLFRRKWLILIGTLTVTLVGVLYGAFMRPSENYEAASSLLVTPPVYKTELSPETFAVDVYEALAGAQDLKQSIIDSLDLRDRSGKKLSVSALDGALETEVAAKSASSSLMYFRVRSTDTLVVPPVAVANAWATQFVDKNSGISSRETVGSYKFIADQFIKSKTRLSSAEDHLREFSETHRPEMMESEYKELKERVEALRQDYLGKSQKLSLLKAGLADLKTRIEREESAEGIWLGFLDIEDGRDQHIDSADLAELTVLMKTTSRHLQEIKNKSDQALTEAVLARRNKQVVEYSAELSDLSVLSETIDRALLEGKWQEGIGSASVNGVISEQTMRELASLQSGYNLFAPRLSFLNGESSRIRVEVDSLQDLTASQGEQIKTLEARYSLLRELHDARHNAYKANKLKVVEFAQTVADTAARVAYQEEELEKIGESYRLLAANLGRVLPEQAQLMREVELAQTAHQKFAGLLDDASVAKARESGDVRVGAWAVDVRVTRQSSPKIAGISFGLGLFGSVLLAFLWDAVARARERHTGELRSESGSTTYGKVGT